MTMVVNNLNDMTIARNEHAAYIHDCNVLLKLYGDSVAIIDLDNALKAGKTCKNTALPLPMLIMVIMDCTAF